LNYPVSDVGNGSKQKLTNQTLTGASDMIAAAAKSGYDVRKFNAQVGLLLIKLRILPMLSLKNIDVQNFADFVI